MDTKQTIRVSQVIGSSICVAIEDGQKVFDILHQAISESTQLNVSFEGIELIISAFLNTAIGQLYGEFSEKEIEDTIFYLFLEKDDQELLQIVVDNAKRYYRNQKEYDSAMQEVLEYA